MRQWGVTEACGYVYLRHNLAYLREQKEVAYGTLLLDEDLHNASFTEKVDWAYIAQIEKDYGLPYLWPYLAVDRIIRHGQAVREYPHDEAPYTHEEMARMLQVTARAIISMLDTERPDFVYLPVVSSLGNMLLYHIAKKKGIRVLVGAETRIDGGYALSEDYRTFSFVDERFAQLRTGATGNEEAARTYIKKYRDAPRPYLYVMEQFKRSGSRARALRWFLPSSLWRSASWFAVVLSRALAGKARDYTDEAPWGFFIDRVQRKARLMRGYHDLYDTPVEGEAYAYYPLHLDPEMATLLLAPYWTDQLNLIKQIARSLPLHFKLYVKEHPAMVGYRTRAYYQTLKKIPNVRLVHPNLDNYRLIKESRLLCTITGTAGWEALLFKKPVITFGDVYFNRVSMVKKCERIDELPLLVQQQVERFNFDEHELEQYVAALLERSANVSLHRLWEVGADKKEMVHNLESFCALLGPAAGLVKQ